MDFKEANENAGHFTRKILGPSSAEGARVNPDADWISLTRVTRWPQLLTTTTTAFTHYAARC